MGTVQYLQEYGLKYVKLLKELGEHEFSRKVHQRVSELLVERFNSDEE
jgi:hypothetical protein